MKHHHTIVKVVYHESVHAVIATLLGRTVSSIFINRPRSGEPVYGTCSYSFQLPQHVTRADVLTHSMAPTPGERILCEKIGWKPKDAWWHCSDYYEALVNGYPCTLDDLHAAEARAEVLLRQAHVWAAVEALAQHILSKMTRGEEYLIFDFECNPIINAALASEVVPA